MGEETQQQSGEPKKEEGQQQTQQQTEAKTFSADYVHELREENAKTRVKHKELEKQYGDLSSQFESVKKTLSTAFGLKDGDTSPEALQTALKEKDSLIKSQEATIKELKVGSRLSAQYAKHSVDPELTQSLLNTKGYLKELDPEDSEFDKKLSAAIKRVSEEHPVIKVNGSQAQSSQASSSGGGDTRGKGDDGAKGQLTVADTKNMTPEEVLKAVKEGKFNNALGRK